MWKRILPLLLLCLLLCGCAESGAAPADNPILSSAALTPLAAVHSPAPSSAAETLPPLRISEAMSSHRATLAADDGSFPDWVELRNEGDAPVSLEGCLLCCGSGVFALPAQELAPGGCALVFCSKERTGFGISADGEMLTLRGESGAVIDCLQLPALEKDRSFSHEGLCRWPTPGFENSFAGYAAFQQSRLPQELAIGEAVLYAEGGDWVELVNTGEEPLNLADYCLSDRESERLTGALPEKKLAPGARFVVPLSELGFGLSVGGDRLYLSRADGSLIDYAELSDVPLGGSVGRLEGEGGFFYFAAATPGRENGEGFRRISGSPESPEPDGVFDGVESYTVTLSGPGEIRYSLDGSVPTAESPLYTEPITLTATGVLRAVCIEEGALPGPALTRSYILNEGHVLPVFSLVCEPGEMFSNKGIYKRPTEDIEIAGTAAFFDGEERFAIDCGVKIHGATSRLYQEKKSLKLLFRPRYEGRLHYDLFGSGVTEFASILLRAPQEPAGSSLIRDSLLHALAAEAFPALCTQDSRYAVLYINGQYWGVYSLREAHSSTHYAQHYGRDEAAVLHYKGIWGKETGFGELYPFAVNNDMRKEENFQKVAEHLDLDSVIGWTIIQAYCGNVDGHSSNMRFYYTLDDETLHYALVDLDHGMEDYRGFSSPLEFGYRYNYLARALLNNADYRKEFLRQLGEALDGPLKPENTIERIDAMAAELRPEMARDRERWNFSLERWEQLVEHNKDYFRFYEDRVYTLEFSLGTYIGSTPEWKEWKAARMGG